MAGAQNKNILVTGGAGYIGSHTCQALAAHGFTPIVYDSLMTGNRGAVKWGPFEQGDVRDRARLAQVISMYEPVAIMHFAALIQVGESSAHPAKYYDNNVHGSWCLLEEARRNDIHHLVFSSTAAVYGMPHGHSIAEDHPLVPINPYGRTKLIMENMIRDYAAAYPMSYAILRYFNAAGADPSGELGTAYPVDTHLIPLLMQVAGGIRPEIHVYGTDYPTPDGTAIRDYIHVADLADAHVRALEKLLVGAESLTLNLGTSQGFSVAQVLGEARQVTGHAIPSALHDRRVGDPPILVADADLARDVLSWQPRFSDIETIIATAWAWRQKQNEHGRDGAFNAPSQPPANRRAV